MDYQFKRFFWFDCLVLMFQKEVADRIIAEFNTSNYGRLSIICNWKLNIKKYVISSHILFSKAESGKLFVNFSSKNKFC